MSVSYISESTKLRLWGKTAGRCEYDGCNRPLWLDSLTKEEFNTAYIAHIIADSPDGPRGHPSLSAQLASDISNLMLMCDEHHRLIDKGDVPGHPVERLREMKKRHESRIETVSAIKEEKQSHILLYGANIGEQASSLSYHEAALAMNPERFPAETRPITLGLTNSSFEDQVPNYWTLEAAQLRTTFERQVRARIKAGEIRHLSVFALAPQPLLILLGSLLSDISASEVYQLRREPRGWKWESVPAQSDYQISAPAIQTPGDAALVFSLSASVKEDRIASALGKQLPVWHVSIKDPHNDFLRSRAQAEGFRRLVRPLMDRIKAAHGQNAVLHVFPAMPVALAVDFGRVLMPKADLECLIYDQNRKLGGFAPVLKIGGAPDTTDRN